MLNKFAAVAVIAASLGLGTVAIAQDTGGGVSTSTGDISTLPAAGQSTGVVTQVDQTDRTVTLDDGYIYDLPKGFNIGVLKNGQKVNVVWEHTGGRLHVTTLELAS